MRRCGTARLNIALGCEVWFDRRVSGVVAQMVGGCLRRLHGPAVDGPIRRVGFFFEAVGLGIAAMSLFGLVCLGVVVLTFSSSSLIGLGRCTHRTG